MITPKRIAWGATGFAIVLAVLPALWIDDIGLENYSANVAVLTATLVALIWYTYFSRLGVEEARLAPAREAAFRRRALAAALLAEMERLEPELQSRTGRPEEMRPRSPMLSRALDQAHTFPPRAAVLMSELSSMLDELAELYRTADEIGRKAQESSGNHAAKLRNLATQESMDLLELAREASSKAGELAADLKTLNHNPDGSKP